ncbi:MAG: glycosyltransferase family 4 protein [Chthoniobacterales bacterium]|nr:glycosyltransferase family 4 protein [Chthoniobacterales bacterium]
MSTRFFIASGCPIATTTLYRCVHLQEQLQHLGYRAEVAEWFDETQIHCNVTLNYDVIILYRLAMCAPLRRLIDQARDVDKPIIFDTDDLIFEPDLIEQHRAVANLTPAEQELHAEGVRRYQETLLACNAVLTATPMLAELARRRGKKAFVHRNAMGDEMFALANHLYERRQERPVTDRIVIGYGSGTATHDVDFKEVSGALEQVLGRFAQAELWIVGPLALSEKLESYGEQIRRFPLTDWRGWFDLVSELDIALAPLELGNVFCRAKSEIKFVEAGALGIPVVASDIDPFRHAVTDGEDGLLASDERDWAGALSQLIERPEERRRIGEGARAKVLKHYTLEARATELAAILPELIDSCGATRSAMTVPQ